MQKLNSILKFIRTHKLPDRKTYAGLKYSARKQGYDVIEWQRNLPKHERLLELLKCLQLSLYKDGFTYKDENKGIIFISRSLPEYEKKILLKHELIHIHLGHIKPGVRITVTQENDTTEFAHSVELILKFIQFIKRAAIIGALCCAVLIRFL